MGAWTTAVGKDVRVIAAGFFKSVGKDRKAIESAVVVDSVGQLLRWRIHPGGSECHRSERISEDVSDELSLHATFGLLCFRNIPLLCQPGRFID